MASAKKVSLGGSGRCGRVASGFEDAPLERLAHAARDGEPLIDPQGHRRIADAFDTLRSHRRLDRDDLGRNDALWEAGNRFSRHWHLGRLGGVTAFDFSRESVDGTGHAGATAPSEAALHHRDAYRRATEVVGPRLLFYLVRIVIDGQTIESLRPHVTDTSHGRTADALIIERLREALDRLCDHWGMGRVKRAGSPATRR